MCAVWCVLSVGSTFSTNDFLWRRLGSIGKYAIMVIGVCGIVLFALFGMLHSRSNIFYANATAFTYRTLERIARLLPSGGANVSALGSLLL